MSGGGIAGGIGGGGAFFVGGSFFFVGECGSGMIGVFPGLPDLTGNGSPNMTLALGGRFRTAVGQSVGAACLPAGTFGSQIRHIPAGGRWPAGTLSP